MQWAIGTNKPLVTNGVALAQGDTSVAPRTAIGFKDGGKTMFLLITDGRQTQVALGTTLKQTADMLVALGADTGLNLDGGGSTTLVARPLGGDTATLRNTPSDGSQRADPAGIGLFVTPGDGKVDSLVVTPSGDDARVFPGLHRTLTRDRASTIIRSPSRPTTSRGRPAPPAATCTPRRTPRTTSPSRRPPARSSRTPRSASCTRCARSSSRAAACRSPTRPRTSRRR